MNDKKKIIRELKNEILSYEYNYDDLYMLLCQNFDITIVAIFSSLFYLFKSKSNTFNDEVIDNMIGLLENFVNDSKNKKYLKKLYDKTEVFLSNVNKSLDIVKQKELDNYVLRLINIQNECLAKPLHKNLDDKYTFILYLIFQSRDLVLLDRFLKENMKTLLNSNSILPAIFIKVIEKFISIDSENKLEIKYYNQVINLLLKGKFFSKLFASDDNEFMKILKNSRKNFVWDLVDKIEDDFVTTRENLAKEYEVSLVFPKNLEKILPRNIGLTDFTWQNIITIDSENDLCLDDALYIEKNSDGTYTLYIHLSNIPSLIPYHSNIIREALKRVETLYLDDMEVPVFEAYLANDMLSILPNKKTNTLTYVMQLDTDFSVILDTIKLVPGVVINKNKLSYEKVDDILKHGEKSSLYDEIVMLSEAINRLSKENLHIRTFHKIDNILEGKSNTDSSKSGISMSHRIVENSMIFVNRLPDILNKYYHLNMPLIHRVFPVLDEEIIKMILKEANYIDLNNKRITRIAKKIMNEAYYSVKDSHHEQLKIDGYTRISAAARRANPDALMQYVLYDLYIDRDIGDLDIKYYFWEKEVNYWCNYANNKMIENKSFADEYNYLHSKGKILEKK